MGAVAAVLFLGVMGASPTVLGLLNSSFAFSAVLAAPFVPWLISRYGYRFHAIRVRRRGTDR
jgi:MFS family permease